MCSSILSLSFTQMGLALGLKPGRWQFYTLVHRNYKSVFILEKLMFRFFSFPLHDNNNNLSFTSFVQNPHITSQHKLCVGIRIKNTCRHKAKSIQRHKKHFRRTSNIYHSTTAEITDMHDCRHRHKVTVCVKWAQTHSRSAHHVFLDSMWQNLVCHMGHAHTHTHSHWQTHTHHLGFNQFFYGANQLCSAGHLRGGLQGG